MASQFDFSMPGFSCIRTHSIVYILRRGVCCRNNSSSATDGQALSSSPLSYSVASHTARFWNLVLPAGTISPHLTAVKYLGEKFLFLPKNIWYLVNHHQTSQFVGRHWRWLLTFLETAVMTARAKAGWWVFLFYFILLSLHDWLRDGQQEDPGKSLLQCRWRNSEDWLMR